MASQRQVAEFLLHQIPEDARAQTVRRCVQNLIQIQSTDGASLAASLLAEYPDEEAKEQFLEYLFDLLQRGHSAEVQALCARDGQIAQQLLGVVIERLYHTALRLERPRAGDTSAPALSSRDKLVPKYSISAPLINFAQNVTLYEIDNGSFGQLFSALLVILGHSQVSLRMAARNVLVAVFSSSNRTHKVDNRLVWQRIKEMVSNTADFSSATLAYSLWLRWAAAKPQSLAAWFDESYWTLILKGLRSGDTEARKQCLGILRQSVAVAAQDLSLCKQICSYTDDSLSPQSIQSQYDRFLTIFETIILGRYINQVMECQADLELLASEDSLVQSRWVCCLLAAALDVKIQDSNRKFIGNWITKSQYQPQQPSELTLFLRHSLLPWLVQGHLFTSSLRRQKNRPQCAHGERLAQYIADLLHRNEAKPKLVAELVDNVLELLTGPMSARFAYAIVYLVQGLRLGIQRVSGFTLSAVQLDKLAGLAASTNLPEVARDFVFVSCLKVVSDTACAAEAKVSQLAVKEQWAQVRAVATSLDDKHVHGPLAPRHASLSKREEHERDIGKKLRCFLDTVALDPTDGQSTPQIHSTLLELWSEIEFAEYPKRLLLEFTRLLFSPVIVQHALSDEALGTLMARLVNELQGMTGTRIYLFAPLIVGISKTIIASPPFAKVVRPSEFILRFCDHLSEPSIDMRMEEATAILLQSTLSDEFRRFDYHYYFGEKASLGVATLLELVGRLGSIDSESLNDIFAHLRGQWASQKSPPPTVSTWKSTLQLQVMILCCEQIIPTAPVVEAKRIMHDLHYALSIEPLPRYRYLLSWIISRAYLRHEHLQSSILDELATKDHQSNPKYLASLMKIGVMLAKVPDATEAFASKLASACIPLAASSKVVIRHEAQWQIPVLLDHARDQGWSTVAENAGLLALDEYIRSLDRFDDPPLERQLDRFNPIADHTLTNLAEGRWFALDDIETSTCRREDFVNARRDIDSGSDAPVPSCIPLGDPIWDGVQPRRAADDAGDDDAALLPLKPSTADLTLAPSSKSQSSRALQTKGSAYLTATSPHARRRTVIVVASLVDNPHNLGGISRAAEVLGVAELHLQNQNVTANRDFQNVAVSSHLHFPIFQLSAGAVPEYLAGQRSDGYCVVGIEQTDRSVLVGSPQCELPEKVVLVMGSEKEGIPAMVLGECDMLVEIPQRGVTRSLNVQTAVAIVLYEYARQHPGDDEP